MQAGLFTMPLHPPGANFTQTLKADLSQIVALDEMGYSEAWIGEHFTSEWENIPSPELFIAQAIGMTKTIRLGTGVSCMPNHNPFVLACRIAQLDHMAEGRFNWGIGTGSFPGDMQVFGYWGEQATVDNGAYTRASLDTILQLWADPKPGVYETEWWRFTIPETEDDIGLRAVERPVHVRDFHATILHQLGLDQEELTFLHDGREEKLTDTGGQVIREIL